MEGQPMSDEKPMGQIIQIDEARIRDHLCEMVRGTVEETLNAMLDAEADQLCGAGRYERSQAEAEYEVARVSDPQFRRHLFEFELRDRRDQKNATKMRCAWRRR